MSIRPARRLCPVKQREHPIEISGGLLHDDPGNNAGQLRQHNQNPAHTNEVSASQTPFGGRIAHGILGAGFISAVLGMKLPGPGTIYLGQELKFTRPVHIGDTVTATCTVREIIPEKNIVKFDTVCTNQRDEIVIQGMATVMPPKA